MRFSKDGLTEFSGKVDKKLRHLVRRPLIIAKHAMANQSGAERFIFHHIPKCAGTSAVDALTNWFVVVKDYPPPWAESSDPEGYKAFCDRPIDLQKLKPYQILVGHFHVDQSYLQQRYPDWKSHGFKLFTFVRNPLELQISQYKYEIKMKRMSASENLEHRLMLRPNWIAERFPCTESNYQQVLDRYAFVATVDNYQKAFDRLANLVGKPPIHLKNYNSTEKRQFKLSDSFISEFKDRHALDYKIYEYARERERDEVRATEDLVTA